MAVIFPDIEAHVVSYLNNALDEREITGVRVGTKKLPAGSALPQTAEVVVIGNYTGTLDWVRSDATLTIDVYADDYSTASDIARTIGALIAQIPGEYVKRAVVSLGPIRLSDEAPLEKRSMTVDLIVKGSDF